MKSAIKRLATIQMPTFAGDNIYMHPIELGQPVQLPHALRRWTGLITNALKFSPIQHGTAYVTIDEREVQAGESQRRGGAHVDGNFLFDWKPDPGGGGWKAGDNGVYLTPEQHKLQYCSPTGGMLIVSSYQACRAWNGDFRGEPRQGGDCSHLSDQLERMDSFLLAPSGLYWMNSTGIHESLPLPERVKRSLLRITLPHDAPLLA